VNNFIPENSENPTMNLSEDLSVDKELFSGVYEGKYIIIPVYICSIYTILNLIIGVLSLYI
jgi:hypothetical protein